MIGSFRRALYSTYSVSLGRLVTDERIRRTYAGRMNFIPRDGFHPAQSRLKMETMTTPSLSERLDYLRGASPKWRELYDELVARLRALAATSGSICTTGSAERLACFPCPRPSSCERTVSSNTRSSSQISGFAQSRRMSCGLSPH